MNGILVIAEVADSKVRHETFAAIACGQHLRNGPEALSVLVVAPDREPLRQLDIADVDEIIHVESEPSSDAVAHSIAGLVADRSLRLILAGQTVNSAGYGARLAIDLGGGFAPGVVDARGHGDGLKVTRDVYGGRLQTELAISAGHPAVLLVRSSKDLDPQVAKKGTGPSLTSHSSPPSESVRSHHLRTEAPVAGETGLQGARFVIGIGRGVRDREDIGIFDALARQVGAVLGSSRPLVDAGWMTRDRQVGQSGTAIDAAVYLAFGISGAAEHLAGIRGADAVVAINTDPHAPIFGVAKYGIVADATEVAEALQRVWE